MLYIITHFIYWLMPFVWSDLDKRPTTHRPFRVRWRGDPAFINRNPAPGLVIIHENGAHQSTNHFNFIKTAKVARSFGRYICKYVLVSYRVVRQYVLLRSADHLMPIAGEGKTLSKKNIYSICSRWSSAAIDSFSAQFHCIVIKIENLANVPIGFCGDETPLSFHEINSLSLISPRNDNAKSAKLLM